MYSDGMICIHPMTKPQDIYKLEGKLPRIQNIPHPVMYMRSTTIYAPFLSLLSKPEYHRPEENAKEKRQIPAKPDSLR